jgi:hypothetical protein
MTRSSNPRLAILIAVLSAGCPLPPPPAPAVTVGGVWTARLPAPDASASARIVTLWLQPGGAATLETVDVGQGRKPVESGTWFATATDLAVRLDGAAAPLVFTVEKDRLVPKEWDRAAYGATGLPLTRRSSSAPKPSIWQPANQPIGGGAP